MSPPSSRDAQNPVIGIMRCKCGKVMKVRRLALGRAGKCRGCGRLMHADRDRIEPRPRRGELVKDRQPSAFSDPFAEPAPGEMEWPEEEWAEESIPSDPPVAIAPNHAPAEVAPADAVSDDEAWDSEVWDDVDADAGVPETPRSEEADWEEPCAPGAEDALDHDTTVPPVLPVAGPDTDPLLAGVSTPDAEPDSAPQDWDDHPWDDAEPAAHVSENPVDALPEDSGAFDVPFDEAELEDVDNAVPERGTSWDAVAPLKEPPVPPSGGTAWDAMAPADALSVEPPPATADGTSWDSVAPVPDAPPAAIPPPLPDASWDDVLPEPAAPAPSAAAGPEESGWDHDPTPPPAVRRMPPPQQGDTKWDGVAPTSPDAVADLGPGVWDALQPPGGSDSIWDPEAPTPSFDDALAYEEAGSKPPRSALAPNEAIDAPFDSADEWLPGDSDADLRSAPTAPMQAATTPVGKVRAPWLVFPLALITASVYYLYWVYQVCCELRDHLVRRQQTSPALALGLHFVPVVNLVWPHYMVYRIAVDLNEIHNLEGRNPAIGAGTVTAMAASGTLFMWIGVGVLMSASALGAVGLVTGVALWGGTMAMLQGALNAHWQLH